MSRVVLACFLCIVAGSATAATAPTLVTLRVEERPALELVEILARECQSGISADPSVLEALGKPVSLAFDHVPWDHACSVIANTLGLDLALTGGLLRVVPTGTAHESERLVMQVHDVTTIIRAVPGHDALPLDLAHALENSRAIVDRFPTDAASRSGELNEVIESIQRLVEPRSWENEGVAIEDWNGSMVITNTPAIQTQVLARLAFQEALAQRQCVCRVYRLGQLPLQTGTVLTAQEWSTMATALPPPAAVFVAHNEQLQRHFAGLQRALLLDADQNQNQHDPLARVVSTGLSLSLRPTILTDGVRVETLLWATVDAQFPTQNITDAAGHALVTITTPRLTIDQADDLREIPTGGAAIYRFGERSYALTVEVVDLPALKR